MFRTSSNRLDTSSVSMSSVATRICLSPMTEEAVLFPEASASPVDDALDCALTSSPPFPAPSATRPDVPGGAPGAPSLAVSPPQATANPRTLPVMTTSSAGARYRLVGLLSSPPLNLQQSEMQT